MREPYKGSKNKFKIGDFVTLHPNKNYEKIGLRDENINVENSYEVIYIWTQNTFIWNREINYTLDTEDSGWVNFDSSYPESYLRPMRKKI